MTKESLKSPDLYINRELSWLEFNDRVLREGLSERLPLMERLKFLAIVSSNLDEFFQVRVAGLMQQRAANIRRKDFAGLTPRAQLNAISERAHRMVAEQSEGIRAALGELAKHGLHVLESREWADDQKAFLRSYFNKEILPVLTPLAIQELDRPPLLSGLRLNVAMLITSQKEGDDGSPEERIIVVPVPSQFPRFVTIPAEDEIYLARLEDVIADNCSALYPDSTVLGTAVFQITRDADVTVQDDEAGDLLHAIEEAVLDRRRRAAVGLTVSADADRRLKKWLTEWLELRRQDVYEVEGMLAPAALWELANRPGFDHLRNPDWPPQQPKDLIGRDDLWQALQEHDVLLFHPYESFDPLVQLLQQAAIDPQVLAIKQTLYRTSGDSPVVRALERAAENGKEVTVLVELKARFDEARNVVWARRLEDSGCHVIYGIAGYKTHAKALLIVRRESHRIARYVHLATGNYNDKTAKLYSDLGLMTCDRNIATDVAAFFNLLTGYSETVGWSRLIIAPTDLKQQFIDMIDRESRASTPDRPGLVMAKSNSLQDRDIIEALYRASQAGVQIRLNVRGICCLRPGIKGVSENIEVTSIIDRYLEHARVFYFRNGGHEEVYLSSADWMRRNLDKRLEIMFPVVDQKARLRVIDILKTYFADNVQARRLLSDGSYEPVATKRRKVHAQAQFYKAAVDAVRTAGQTATRFVPMTGPKAS